VRRAGIEARPHGFGSSVRTLIAETKSVSREVAEMVLAHRPTSEVIGASERTDFLHQRKEITQKWPAYVLG